jgi:hypothetical protein
MSNGKEKGWADVAKRQQQRLEEGVLDIPEREREILEFEAQLRVQPMYHTELLTQIRNILIDLTNEIKYANEKTFGQEGYVPHYLDVLDKVVEVPVSEDVVQPEPEPTPGEVYVVVEPPKPKIEGEENIVNHFKTILKTYEVDGKRYFSDEELDNFKFGIEEDKVVMRPTWIKEGFGAFLRFVKDEMKGEYQDGKGLYHLELP